MKSKTMVLGILVLAIIGIVLFSGCAEVPVTPAPGEGEEAAPAAPVAGPSGTEYYSGTWSGTWLGSAVDGTFELTVNFDDGTVTGTMNGGYPGTVSGSVSKLAISAEGTVSNYAVTWSGNVSADGSSISGNWECAIAGIGSGTWSGTKGKAPAVSEPEGKEEQPPEEVEEQVPTADVSGAEDISNLPRYPDSVIIFYGSVPGVEETLIVTYLTPASIETVAEFYEQELPENGWTIMASTSEVEGKEITALKEDQGTAVIGIGVSEDYADYTEINISYMSTETAID